MHFTAVFYGLEAQILCILHGSMGQMRTRACTKPCLPTTTKHAFYTATWAKGECQKHAVYGYFYTFCTSAYVWNTTGATNFELFQEPYGPGPQVCLCLEYHWRHQF